MEEKKINIKSDASQISDITASIADNSQVPTSSMTDYTKYTDNEQDSEEARKATYKVLKYEWMKIDTEWKKLEIARRKKLELEREKMKLEREKMKLERGNNMDEETQTRQIKKVSFDLKEVNKDDPSIMSESVYTLGKEIHTEGDLMHHLIYKNKGILSNKNSDNFTIESRYNRAKKEKQLKVSKPKLEKPSWAKDLFVVPDDCKKIFHDEIIKNLQSGKKIKDLPTIGEIEALDMHFDDIFDSNPREDISIEPKDLKNLRIPQVINRAPRKEHYKKILSKKVKEQQKEDYRKKNPNRRKIG